MNLSELLREASSPRLPILKEGIYSARLLNDCIVQEPKLSPSGEHLVNSNGEFMYTGELPIVRQSNDPKKAQVAWLEFHIEIQQQEDLFRRIQPLKLWGKSQNNNWRDDISIELNSLFRQPGSGISDDDTVENKLQTAYEFLKKNEFKVCVYSYTDRTGSKQLGWSFNLNRLEYDKAKAAVKPSDLPEGIEIGDEPL